MRRRCRATLQQFLHTIYLKWLVPHNLQHSKRALFKDQCNIEQNKVVFLRRMLAQLGLRHALPHDTQFHNTMMV
jgi:hypothetical protein